MPQTIRLNSLPFQPAKKQVIYVENSYDSEINGFIDYYYEQICTLFGNHGREFVYLPRYFREEERVDKILYYAPYLTREEASNFSLNSSVLLHHLSVGMNWQEVKPSLLYNPTKREDTWEFQVKELQDADSFMQSADELVVIYEKEAQNQKQERAGVKFMLPTQEELSIVAENEVRFSREPKPKKSRISLWSSLNQLLLDDEEQKAQPYENDKDITRDLAELKETVERLKLKGLPLAAIHDFIDSQERLSTLIIRRDNTLWLPDYNVEAKMGPLPKALYFLFLRYPQGLILKEIMDHRRELLNIYRELRGGGDEDRLRATIDKLVDPLGNALHENIVRINKAFQEKFDEHLAHNYYVSGEKGKGYRINLPPRMVEWE